MISITETAARMRVMDPISIREDAFGPMTGDTASITEGINIIYPEKERSSFNPYR